MVTKGLADHCFTQHLTQLDCHHLYERYHHWLSDFFARHGLQKLHFSIDFTPSSHFEDITSVATSSA